MKKKLLKMLSVVLCAAMLVGMVPTYENVYAQDSESEIKTQVIAPDAGTDQTYTITFVDYDKEGNLVVSTKRTVKKEAALGSGNLPEAAGQIGKLFKGWYLDKEGTQTFYYSDKANKDFTVYAVYSEVEYEENYTPVTYTLNGKNIKPDLSFVIKKGKNATLAPEDALLLLVKDGSDVPELKVVDNGNGTYTVTAVGGYREGSSYVLNLGEGYTFEGKDESVRSASFIIHKEEVNNTTINDAIINIEDTEDMKYTIGGITYDVLTSDAVANKSETDASNVTGTFNYAGEEEIKVGDILCIYTGENPDDRDYTQNGYIENPAIYIRVTQVDGNVISFSSTDEEDYADILVIPDTIPYQVEALPTTEFGKLDASFYDQLGWQFLNPEVAAPKFTVGDFVVLYQGTFADINEETEVYYGRITDVNGDEITYVKTTVDEMVEAMEKAMNLYLEQEIPGNVLLENIDEEEFVSAVEKDLIESGWAADMADYLKLMLTQTDSYKELGLENVSLTKEDGTPLTEEELKTLVDFEFGNDDIKLKVHLDNKSDRYGKGAVTVAIELTCEFSKDMGDDGELKVELRAAFREELKVDIIADGDCEIGWKVIIPYLKKIWVSTSIDIKSYTAISLDVKLYTVEKEDEGIWGKLQGIEELAEFKEIFEKIEEIEGKIAEVAGEDGEKLQQYYEDAKNIWESAGIIFDGTEVTYDEFKEMRDKLGETEAAGELKELLHMTDEEEIDAGLKSLMERYSELMENKTDYVELLRKSIVDNDFLVFIFAINLKIDFVISGDINLAIGAALEYETGKRYTIYVDIKHFDATISEMDILDETFAFQFYAMGKIGLRVGIDARIGFALGSSKLANVNIGAEFGPYLEMWGYFIYEYSQNRPANTTITYKDDNMMGALYLEFGIYLDIDFRAEAAFGLLSWEANIFDKQWKLLEAGTKKNVYDFGYEVESDEILRLLDEDENGSNGYIMGLPDSYRIMAYMNLVTGVEGKGEYEAGKFTYKVSNSDFSVDEKGNIQAHVEEGERYMETDLIVTWIPDGLTFSKNPISVTIPVVWTNLSDTELNEVYTVSVKVRDLEGTETVWSDRVLKGQEFDLPALETMDDVKALLGEDVAWKYAVNMDTIKYEGVDETTGITINSDTVYYVDVAARYYALTVTDVQNADGTTRTEVLKAKFGEAFDFSVLEETGTSNDVTRAYTKYYGVISTTEGDTNRILTQKIDKNFATLLENGNYTVKAEYIDNSATITFTFPGLPGVNDKTYVVEKGTMPPTAGLLSDTEIKSVITALGKNPEVDTVVITGFMPEVEAATGNITYAAIAEVKEAKRFTFTYDTNGGTEIPSQLIAEGATITAPTDPTKDGYTFRGWFADEACTNAYTFDKMPSANVTIYAKWEANSYELTLHANDGKFANGEDTTIVTVIFGDNYQFGTEVPVREGYKFLGWYTSYTGGTKVTTATKVQTAEAHTLYAQWEEKAEINADEITAQTGQVTTYEKGKAVIVEFTTGEYALDGFKLQYKPQGDTSAEWADTAINAGTYDVKITRAEDDTYKKFEKVVTSVLTINKAKRVVDAFAIDVMDAGYTYLELKLAEGAVDDLSEEAELTYVLCYEQAVQMPVSGKVIADVSAGKSEPGSGYIGNLTPGKEYKVAIAIIGDPNYEDVTVETEKIEDSLGGIVFGYYHVLNSPFVKVSTLAAPTDKWTEHIENTIEFVGRSVYVDTAGELAYIAYLVNNGINNFEGKNIILTADIDLRGHLWEPIGTTDKPFKGNISGHDVINTGRETATIKNMYVMDCNRAGLIGEMTGGGVAYLIMEDSYLKQTVNGIAGGFVASAVNTSFYYCCSKVSIVTSTSNVGGIVGKLTGTEGSLYYCENYGTLSNSGSSIGGIVGYVMNATVEKCNNHGSVTSSGSAVGGIVGALGVSATVCGSVNYGTVDCGYQGGGGIVGLVSNSTVYDCTNHGTVKCKTGDDDYKYIGGIVGKLDGYNVYNCVNFGTVSGDKCVAGVVGYNAAGTITNCANHGKVTGDNEVGGIAGSNDGGDAKVHNCYSVGKVKGSQYVGAVVGRNDDNKGYVDYCYYLKHSASYDGDEYAKAVGAKKEAVDDDHKHVNCASFTDAASKLSRDTGTGGSTLISCLNKFFDKFGNGDGKFSEWYSDETINDYPLPEFTKYFFIGFEK